MHTSVLVTSILTDQRSIPGRAMEPASSENDGSEKEGPPPAAALAAALTGAWGDASLWKTWRMCRQSVSPDQRMPFHCVIGMLRTTCPLHPTFFTTGWVNFTPAQAGLAARRTAAAKPAPKSLKPAACPFPVCPNSAHANALRQIWQAGCGTRNDEY
jgi:hypothetical protein